MWDIWGFACTIAGNEAVRSDEIDIMGSDDSDDSDESGLRWFSDDMPDLKKPATSDEHGRSWYARLSTASSTMLLQLIYVSSKYYDVNGKVVAISTQTTVNLMGRIPTPGARGWRGNRKSSPHEYQRTETWNLFCPIFNTLRTVFPSPLMQRSFPRSQRGITSNFSSTCTFYYLLVRFTDLTILIDLTRLEKETV